MLLSHQCTKPVYAGAVQLSHKRDCRKAIQVGCLVLFVPVKGSRHCSQKVPLGPCSVGVD